jgi:hypothetical protein
VTASVDYRLSPTSTFAVGLGAGLGGFIAVNPPSANPARFEILPGYELTLSYSRRLLDGRGNLPFVLFGLSGGVSGASTQLERVPQPPTIPLYTFDVRASFIVGKTFWNTLSPYALVRGFGGPIVWTYAGSTEIGSDRYHFQLGGGKTF